MLTHPPHYIKDISSFGWRKTLDCAGNRYITVRINVILDCALADRLLHDFAMLNSIIITK
ncbi:MAG: hypothetical protein PV340_04615 [Wolbachia sp.]|nr:hypothetical protein [Wolbachia sp.]MDD9336490.1 hypothetical protein [Wolbachia sp.]